MSLIALYLNLRFLEVHFSVITQFLVHVTSNPKTLKCEKFSNIEGRDIILEIGHEEYISFVIISQTCMNFTLKLDYSTMDFFYYSLKHGFNFT